MRTLSLLLLFTCALPLLVLSQSQTDQSIIRSYAHPAFAELPASSNKIFLASLYSVHLAIAHKPIFNHDEARGFTVVKRLSSLQAIIQITGDIDSCLFKFLVPANNAWKLSARLVEADKKQLTGLRLLVYVNDAKRFKEKLNDQLSVVQEYSENIFIVQLNSKAVWMDLQNSPQLVFADLANRQPKEELIIDGFDLGTNRINVVHQRFPSVTGENLMLSVKENRFDTLDIDLKGRIVNNNIASSNVSGHATIMATMAAGAGNSFYEGKGAAWKAYLQSANFASLVPEPDAFYLSQRISVQNHSYGTGIENFYGADAAAYDASVINNPVLLHVFSAGNSGTSASNGPYTGITGFANLTGSFKMAKNVLVTGAIDSTGKIEALSSRGPTYDGRIKPELVAFGQDGSSGAAALVSGISLLMQHAYQQQHHDSLPTAALVKALLINTADDVGAAGPDFASGYGSANAYEAVKAIRQSQFFTNSIQQGNTQSFTLNIPTGISSFKCTLAWTDPPAQANAVKALVNDLDIELVNTSSGQTWQPWILSRAPNRDSLQSIAIRGRDTLNNVEQVTLNAPPAGNYMINVKGSRITNSQTYFLTYRADTANRFDWLFPLSNDPAIAGASQLVRWNSSFAAGSTGVLQYSLDEGVNWQTIANNIDLSKNYTTWSAPDVFSTALLRMTISGNNYVSDSFVLSKRLSTRVGFNCPDSFLFYWNKPSGINNFRVYRVGDKFLEPVTVVNDSFYLGAATVQRNYTIAPIVKNKEGIKAYTFDYATQGVGCYFRTFLAQLLSNKAALQLELGSVYHVNKILVQKLSGGNFTTIQTTDPKSLQYSFDDAALQSGVNTYRIALQLADGRIIYSGNEVIYYLGTQNYIVYPNPARVTSGFRILQKDAADIRIIMYDVTGRIIKDEMHADLINPVSTANLQKGLYILNIFRDGKREFVGKVVVE